MQPIVKIYGERNSGTNYLENLIQLNLDCTSLKFKSTPLNIFIFKKVKYDIVVNTAFKWQRNKMLGWKHGCPTIQAINKYPLPVLILTITKNPYSFLLSLHKRPYHFKGITASKFSDFIKQNWITRERDLTEKKTLHSPIELWNLKNRSYILLSKKTNNQVINLTYESLLQDPEGIIRNIGNSLKIDLKNNNQFRNYKSSTKNIEQTFNDYKKYYLNEEWKSKLDSQSISQINEELDWDVCKHFQYFKIR